MTEEQAEIVFARFSQMYTDAESKHLDTIKGDFVFHLMNGFAEAGKLYHALEQVDEQSASFCAKALFQFFQDGLTHLNVARHLGLADIFTAEGTTEPCKTSDSH